MSNQKGENMQQEATDYSNARIIEWEENGEAFVGARTSRRCGFQTVNAETQGHNEAGFLTELEAENVGARVVAEFPAPSLAEIVGGAPAPTFDADGYPTDETLDLIEKWPPQDVRGLLRFMAEAWKYSERGPHPIDYLARITPHTGALNEDGYELWYATTGGWSGNEDLIRAFMRNAVAWSISWKASVAGGAYYWRVRKEQA